MWRIYMGGADGALFEKWAEAGPSSEMFSGLGKVTKVPDVAACMPVLWGSANDYCLEPGDTRVPKPWGWVWQPRGFDQFH